MNDMQIEGLPQNFANARQAFSTRRVPASDMHTLVSGPVRPEMGQLVLARVSQIGQHRSVELVSGRKAQLFVGDLLILAYGNRYAPDQFEGLIPLDLGPCDLIAGGGLAAREVARNDSMRAPTAIEPLGLIGDAHGRPLNLRDYALPDIAGGAARVPIYVVCGTSMNSGKTHTAAMLVRGLIASGLRVAACKVTGTGSGNDLWKLRDAGASVVLDFADAGYPSTYGVSVEDLERAYLLLTASASTDADAVVVEIADGLCQAETAGLLRSRTLAAHCDGFLFAAPDPIGAVAGERWLREAGLRVLAISGLMTTCPTSTIEARRLITPPVLTAEQLASGSAFAAILAGTGTA